ncbi:MAG: homoserine kinase [Chloroflexota bacterium]|nr:MAG: homoserine kinase [Chloroflexota bacterium]
MRRIRIQVPATSANLGPGFDCLGLALNLTDTIRVELDADNDEVSLTGVEGTSEELDREESLLCRAYRAWADDTGATLPGARFALESRIPIGRGLGSSAAAIVGGLAAAAFAAEDKEPRQRILRLGTRLEGHPDNVAAATMGGLTVAFCHSDDVRAMHVANHLALGVALYIPDERLGTTQARAALPDHLPVADAVFDLGRLAYLVTALQWGRWSEIGPAMQDRLHQPYRARLLPALDVVMAAAIEAGAYGAALSGAGPTVIALGPTDRAEQFSSAMAEKARREGWAGAGMITSIRQWGVVVSAEDRNP